MIKIKQENPEIITVVKGNKKIKRPFTDYKSNQRMWKFQLLWLTNNCWIVK